MTQPGTSTHLGYMDGGRRGEWACRGKVYGWDGVWQPKFPYTTGKNKDFNKARTLHFSQDLLWR